MTSRMNPNVNLNESESFTEHFNENVDYTRDKAQATSEDIGMDIGQDQSQRGENLAQTQADAQAQTGSGMNTGGTGAFSSDNQVGRFFWLMIFLTSTRSSIACPALVYPRLTARLGGFPCLPAVVLTSLYTGWP